MRRPEDASQLSAADQSAGGTGGQRPLPLGEVRRGRGLPGHASPRWGLARRLAHLYDLTGCAGRAARMRSAAGRARRRPEAGAVPGGGHRDRGPPLGAGVAATAPRERCPNGSGAGNACLRQPSSRPVASGRGSPRCNRYNRYPARYSP